MKLVYSLNPGILLCLFLGSITISPSYGNQLGGTPIIIQGPCFSTEDSIKCSFNDIVVGAVVMSNERAMCISPMLHSAGVVKFAVLNKTEAIGITTFHARELFNIKKLWSLSQYN